MAADLDVMLQGAEHNPQDCNARKPMKLGFMRFLVKTTENIACVSATVKVIVLASAKAAAVAAFADAPYPARPMAAWRVFCVLRAARPKKSKSSSPADKHRRRGRFSLEQIPMKLLYHRDLLAKGIPYSMPQIRKMEADGTFPKRMFFSERNRPWSEEVIDNYIKEIERELKRQTLLARKAAVQRSQTDGQVA